MRTHLMQQIAIAVVSTVLACGVVSAEQGAPASKKLAAGDVPPTALGTTRGGDDIETTQFAGKVLVVTFWASWCAPCRTELSMLDGLQRVAKDRLQVVAINIEERDRFRAVERALSSLAVKLTHDTHKRNAAAYGVNGIPHMVIIGKDGRVINVHRGYNDAALEGLLREINTALGSQ